MRKPTSTMRVAIVVFVTVILGLDACKRANEDPVPVPRGRTTETETTPPTPTTMDFAPQRMLIAERVSTPPSASSKVDAFWNDVVGIEITTTVPAHNIEVDGHDIWWNEYEGRKTDVILKAVYTETDVFILAAWNDAEDSTMRAAWYYDTAHETWLQMGKKYPDEFGNPPAYEDKFAMFWNRSVEQFEKSGCTILCHQQYMSTREPGQVADIWHWKRDRTGPVFQLDDKWLDDAENGRHADQGTGSYEDNVQDLVDSNGRTVSAPMYWIPLRTDYHWIMQSEIDDGTARRIVELNADQNFVDQDGTVLERTQFGYDSNRVIPSLKGIRPGTGSRGDVSAWHDWSNGMWTLKIKRARDTGNEDDVQFTETNKPYWFSLAVMNGAAIAHSIPDNTESAFAFVLRESGNRGP